MNVTTDVNIYNADGDVVNKLSINDWIVYQDGRVSEGNKHYYKGLGTKYRFHFVPDIDNPHKYKTLEHSNIPYLGYKVSQKNFLYQFGIFAVPYQPMFDDWIGACGVKEFSMIENSEVFKYSSVKFVKSYKIVDGQFYFVVDYLCKRVKYVEFPTPQCLYILMQYMVDEGWCFPWDKNSIDDISWNGKVRDVADLFQSTRLEDMVGSIYSIMYSLFKDNDAYDDFIYTYRLSYDYQTATLELLERFGVSTDLLKPYNNKALDACHTFYNYIIKAKNCGDCCKVSEGDRIREYYKEKFKDVNDRIKDTTSG